MKVLVTGATGFLGSHLVQGLTAQGWDVRALVRKNSDLTELPSSIQIIYGDLLDKKSVQEGLESVDGVFHVAGLMSSSPKERENLFKVNVEGTQSIVDLCIEKKIKKLVHVSSVVAVGASLDREILNENSENITLGKSFANYDSKRQGEEIVLKAARAGALNATVVNPSLMYGARDARKSTRKGNLRAAQGKLPFYTSGGVNVVPVEDVVKAMLVAFNSGKSGERYLLTGENITIQELLTTISRLADAQEPRTVLPDKLFLALAKAHDFLGLKTELSQENYFAATAFHWYDNSKAKKDLGFQPGPWQEALKRSVQWMKDNGLLEKK